MPFFTGQDFSYGRVGNLMIQIVTGRFQLVYETLSFLKKLEILLKRWRVMFNDFGLKISVHNENIGIARWF